MMQSSVRWIVTGIAAACAVLPSGLSAQAGYDVTEAPTPDDSARRVVNKLYLDLSGILRPGHKGQPDNPLWPQHLSRRTEALLNRLEAREGSRVFDYDWLCQCTKDEKFRVPVRIMVEDSTDKKARLRVGMRFPGGDVRHVTLTMVYEDGWKIDDIRNERVRDFRTEIDHAITRLSR